MMTIWINCFKNENKTNDTQPIYKNNKLTVQEDTVLKAGTIYQVAMWKDDSKVDTHGNPLKMVKIKIEENTYEKPEEEEAPF